MTLSLEAQIRIMTTQLSFFDTLLEKMQYMTAYFDVDPDFSKEARDIVRSEIAKRLPQDPKEPPIQQIILPLRTILKEALAQYWYETEYVHINHDDLERAEESRRKFIQWLDENLDSFVKTTSTPPAAPKNTIPPTNQ